MLYMDQGRGWTMDDHTLDESLYYVDQLHLIEAGNAKFALSILNTIRNFNDLKFKLQSRMSSHKSPPSIHKPPPSTSPRKPPPSISFHKPPPSTSPHKPRPSTSPHKPPSSTSP